MQVFEQCSLGTGLGTVLLKAHAGEELNHGCSAAKVCESLARLMGGGLKRDFGVAEVAGRMRESGSTQSLPKGTQRTAEEQKLPDPSPLPLPLPPWGHTSD